MAIIICKECNKELSTSAIKCPHCGANYYTASGTPTNNLSLFAELCLIGGVCLCLGGGTIALIISLMLGSYSELKFLITLIFLGIVMLKRLLKKTPPNN